ncbi:hypothetical protein MMC18_001519 [Xylographa bjoerkii]|nr:hypothetical protein [Xylographa bjoerkii]
MSAYAYPPPTSGSGQNAEPYRASPTGSHVSLPSLNLPPIRNLDGRAPTTPQQQQQQQQQQQPAQASQPPSVTQHQHQHQHQQQHQLQHLQHHVQPTSGQNSMGSPLAPPMGQYYPNPQQSLAPPPPHMSGTSDPNQPLRYPLPATDNRMMSGGRNKKEIKRRTKTGCLTCRKRRIKCDEAHPTCRNCIKSKRECLGYDPIFKSQPGPAAIQPAPSSAPSMQPHSATVSPYPPPPQGYMPAGSQPYAPSVTAGATSPDSSVEPYDYSAAIDPALEGTGAAQMQVHSSLYDGTHEAKLGAKPTKIQDLLDVGGYPPPDVKPSTSIPPPAIDEIKTLYLTAYATAIDKFFETRWFTTRGLPHLLVDTNLCEHYNTLLQRVTMPITQPPNYREHAITQSIEAHVIWSTMLLCRQVSAAAHSTNGQNNYIEVNEGVHDAAKRLEIFETLITNQYLDNEALPQSNTSSNRNGLDDQLKYREREFWRLISRFLTLRDDEAASANEIDDTLSQCRHLLDSRENRDVLYSIAIARHIGQRMAEGGKGLGDRPEELSNNEQDPRAKLSVARRFVEGEAAGKGTTQVVQRVCGMAIRSWGGVR